MKVSKSFLRASMCVFVCAKVLVTAGIIPAPTPPAQTLPCSGLSHTGLLLEVCIFGGNYSGLGTHRGGAGRGITVSDDNLRIIS